MNKRIRHQQQHDTSRTMLGKPSHHTPGIEIDVEWTAGNAAATAAEFDRVAARVRAEIVDSATRDGDSANDTHEQDTAAAEPAATPTGADSAAADEAAALRRAAAGRWRRRAEQAEAAIAARDRDSTGAADGRAAAERIPCECPGGAGRCGDCAPPHLGGRPCGKDVGDGTMRPCTRPYGHDNACTPTEGAAPDVDPDEALAQTLRGAWWAAVEDGPERRWQNIARAARDHIEEAR